VSSRRYDRPIASKLRLKVTAGPGVGKELAVDDELEIGRAVEAEGKLDEDIELSRRHARIVRTADESWEIEDLGSRNGTFVNGARLEQRVPLAAGDAIEIGGTKLVVQVSAPTMPSHPDPDPDPEPEQEPEPEKPSPTRVGEATAGEPPPVSLRLDIDVATGEATIALADGSDQVKLAFEDGAWRLRPDA
jgi:pSer/pThr/pTyr-binding forkhead associated (FHA) protein